MRAVADGEVATLATWIASPSGSKSLSSTGTITVRPARTSTTSGLATGAWSTEAMSLTETTTVPSTGSERPSEIE